MQCRDLHLEPSGSRAALSAVRRESLTTMHEAQSKSELRKALRERRRAIPGAERARAGLAVARHIQDLPAWSRSKHIALYLPADGEIETGELIVKAREAGLNLYLPVVGSDDVMHFALWEANALLEKNCYGIPQPGPQYSQRPANKLDIIIMPLVGWSHSGARLGMGGGFYDRALAGAAGPVRVGLGFECQQAEVLPIEPWDIPMDFVVTESALHTCGETG